MAGQRTLACMYPNLSRRQAGDQLPGVDLERSSQAHDVEQRDVALPALHRADIRPVQLGPVSQGLQRPSPALTVTAEALSEPDGRYKSDSGSTHCTRVQGVRRLWVQRLWVL